MKKLSQMGSSKYEFEPEQFDIDILKNNQRYEEKKADIQEQLNNIIESDPVHMEETFEILIDVLRSIKWKYNL